MRQNPEHIREYGSVLATAERHTLISFAERLPSWVTSDMLTILGLASMVLAGMSFWAARWYDDALFIVVVALALNWFGDSLDGTVARVRKQQRPRYGYYVDHVIDIIGVCFLFGGPGRVRLHVSADRDGIAGRLPPGNGGAVSGHLLLGSIQVVPIQDGTHGIAHPAGGGHLVPAAQAGGVCGRPRPVSSFRHWWVGRHRRVRIGHARGRPRGTPAFSIRQNPYPPLPRSRGKT